MSSELLLYDGSFDGFLTCVFESFDLKLKQVIIQKSSRPQTNLFATSVNVITDETKSNRVWAGLKKKLSSSACNQMYYTFLSEQPEVEMLLYDYIKKAFDNEHSIATDFSDPSVLKVAQIAKMVGREKHRMEAFIRFKLTKDDIYFANIDPDFDVLPIILKHFKSRYADQKWLIYDLKRSYGIFYDLKTVETIHLEMADDFDATKTDSLYFSEDEMDFQTLWKNYFDSTNIASRKNMKLHIRHVPKRYWKYLSEKQP